MMGLLGLSPSGVREQLLDSSAVERTVRLPAQLAFGCGFGSLSLAVGGRTGLASGKAGLPGRGDSLSL